MGKRFDTESVKSRMLAGLRKKEDWALILDNGTVGNLIDTIAETENELSRYMEFLYQEKKWSTAQLQSSLQTQSDLLGYKRQLPVSALGYVVVSHTDVHGMDRLSYYGTYYFDLDAPSNYDGITVSDTDDDSEKHALVPWTSSGNYTIPAGTRFISNSGVEFFSTEIMTIHTLKKSLGAMTSSELEEFYKSGGWNGCKYLKIPVMQGIKKTISIGHVDSQTRFQTCIIPTLDVEAASNAVSVNYFKVYVKPDNGAEDVYFTEIDRLSRAGTYENVYEKKILKDESGIQIKFGDDISGAIPPSGIVYVDYVETLGSSGNIQSNYQLTKMVLPSDTTLTDPRDNSNGTFLSCTNICGILGGRDIEDIDDFKESAPKSYLSSYTAGTDEALREAIQRYSPVSMLHTKIFYENSLDNYQIHYDIGVNLTDSVEDEINELSNKIYISALSNTGELYTDDEIDNNIIPILEKSLYGIKNPSDIIAFKQPNLIKIIPSVKVHTKTMEYEDDEISESIKEAINEKYSIFVQDFTDPIYKSEIIRLAKSFDFSDSVEVTLDYAANVDYDSISVFDSNIYSDSAVVKVPFSFNNLILRNEVATGFRDNKVNANYLLKVNIKFINNSLRSSDGITLLLYDNRVDETGAVTLEEGRNLNIDGTDFTAKSYDVNNDYTIYNSTCTADELNNVQVRIAQFDYISEIIDDEFAIKLKSYDASPSENLKYEIDTDGKFVEYQDTNSSGSYELINNTYYKSNTKYVEGLDVTFFIDESNQTLTGYIMIPLSFLQFSSISQAALDEDDVTALKSLLKQYVSIEVLGQPVQEDFIDLNDDEIIYIDNDDIKVEINTII